MMSVSKCIVVRKCIVVCIVPPVYMYRSGETPRGYLLCSPISSYDTIDESIQQSAPAVRRETRDHIRPSNGFARVFSGIFVFSAFVFSIFRLAEKKKANKFRQQKQPCGAALNYSLFEYGMYEAVFPFLGSIKKKNMYVEVSIIHVFKSDAYLCLVLGGPCTHVILLKALSA